MEKALYFPQKAQKALYPTKKPIYSANKYSAQAHAACLLVPFCTSAKYIYIYTYLYVHTYIYTCTYTHIYMYICVHVYIYTNQPMPRLPCWRIHSHCVWRALRPQYTHTHTHTHISISISISIYIYIFYTHIHIYVYTYMYILTAANPPMPRLPCLRIHSHCVWRALRPRVAPQRRAAAC